MSYHRFPLRAGDRRQPLPLTPAARRFRAAWRASGRDRAALAALLGRSLPTASRYYRDPHQLTGHQRALVAAALGITLPQLAELLGEVVNLSADVQTVMD